MKKFSELLGRVVPFHRLYDFKMLRRRQSYPVAKSGPAIRYHLDSLENPTFESTATVPVIGWACAKAGIAAIDIYLNDTFLKQIMVGRPRPDVAAAYPDLVDAGQSGFSEVLNLRGERTGYHTLALEMHDRAGHTV